MNIHTTIITHRGLDPDNDLGKKYFKESSIEAFDDQLQRGYGIEFDIQITKDKEFVVIHDNNLSRLTNHTDNRLIEDIELRELLEMDLGSSHLCSLSKILDLIEKKSRPDTISALHLKSELQKKDILDLLIKKIRTKDLSKFIIFDVLKETAIYLKQSLKDIQLAPSVAHIYDIERYNKFVGGTLWKLEDVILNQALFYGVWLDEWDTLDKDGTKKTLYNKKIFDIIRSNNLKIFLVTPDLHFISPGLYAKEVHEDAIGSDKLMKRIEKIIRLKPDSLCTDYPDKVNNLIKYTYPLLRKEF